jgi:CxxC motif-containing protein
LIPIGLGVYVQKNRRKTRKSSSIRGFLTLPRGKTDLLDYEKGEISQPSRFVFGNFQIKKATLVLSSCLERVPAKQGTMTRQ